MAEYISRDDGKIAAWQILSGMGYDPKRNDRLVEEVEAVFDDVPACDVRKVVTCKDCAYNVANRLEDPLDITDYTDIVCDYFMTDGMSANDYCSHGKRRYHNG